MKIKFLVNWNNIRYTSIFNATYTNNKYTTTHVYTYIILYIIRVTANKSFLFHTKISLHNCFCNTCDNVKQIASLVPRSREPFEKLHVTDCWPISLALAKYIAANITIMLWNKTNFMRYFSLTDVKS